MHWKGTSFPRIGARPASEVTSRDVLEILANPCDRIRATLGRWRDVVQHMRVLAHAEVAAGLQTVQASRTTTAANFAFEFRC